VITTFGSDFAVASTLFYRASASGKVGRQIQTWVRLDGRWQIVAAHMSMIDEPPVCAVGRHCRSIVTSRVELVIQRAGVRDDVDLHAIQNPRRRRSCLSRSRSAGV
jgi:hypothetical protein